jgi:hypothetical protein
VFILCFAIHLVRSSGSLLKTRATSSPKIAHSSLSPNTFCHHTLLLRNLVLAIQVRFTKLVVDVRSRPRLRRVVILSVHKRHHLRRCTLFFVLLLQTKFSVTHCGLSAARTSLIASAPFFALFASLLKKAKTLESVPCDTVRHSRLPHPNRLQSLSAVLRIQDLHLPLDFELATFEDLRQLEPHLVFLAPVLVVFASGVPQCGTTAVLVDQLEDLAAGPFGAFHVHDDEVQHGGLSNRAPNLGFFMLATSTRTCCQLKANTDREHRTGSNLQHLLRPLL